MRAGLRATLTLGLMMLLAAGCATTTRTGVPTPLHIAAGKGQYHEVERLLIVSSPNVRYSTSEFAADRDLHGTAPIHWAVKNDHLETAELLLKGGANPDARDGKGLTPLHYAAMGGHPDSVKRLIELGANPLVSDDRGWTPLHHAAQSGHPMTVNTLLEMGSEPYLLTDVGQSPLDLAKQFDHPQTAFVIEEYLKKHVMPGVTAEVQPVRRRGTRRLLFWHSF